MPNGTNKLLSFNIVRFAYYYNSLFSTVMKGCLDSLAAGMLIYTALNLVITSFADEDFEFQTIGIINKKRIANGRRGRRECLREFLNLFLTN
jgi:hypothetical protein